MDHTFEVFKEKWLLFRAHSKYVIYMYTLYVHVRTGDNLSRSRAKGAMASAATALR